MKYNQIKTSILILLSVLNGSCDQGENKSAHSVSAMDYSANEISKERDSVRQIGESSNNPKILDSVLLEGAIGILVIEDNYTEGDTVLLQNEDGSTWYKFTFFYDDTDGKFEYKNNDFFPFAFNPDHFLLCMKVVEIGNRFKVIVNDEKNIYKYVERDKFWNFQLWEEFILSVFAVEYKSRTYDIHAKPTGDSEVWKRVDSQSAFIFTPIQIQDEWLKVEWEEPSGARLDGWIRWRTDEKLLIHTLPYA